MGALERISVEVSAELAAFVRERVSSGRFANESEAIADALRRAEADDRDTDAWLRHVVVPICASVEAGTATLLTLDEVRDRLKTGR